MSFSLLIFQEKARYATMQGKCKVKNKGQVPNLKKGPRSISKKKCDVAKLQRDKTKKAVRPRTEGEKLRQALVKDMNDKILAQVTAKASNDGTHLNIVKSDSKAQ
jgi:hypothetical protein